MNPYNNDNTNDSNISSNSLDNITSRVRKRDRLKSLVQSGTSAIKQEINKRYNEYYYTSSSKSISLRSLSSSQTSFTDLHTNNSSSSLYHQVDENSNVNDNKIQRTETQKAVDEILPEDVRLSETVQSQCLLFPTYACQLVDSKDNATIRYKTVLAGWAFTKPSSTSRLDRFLRAAGRTYGGIARNSAEDDHFSNLFNQFRCQPMRMASICLALPGINSSNHHHHHHHHHYYLEHLTDTKQGKKENNSNEFTTTIRTNPNGRFQETIYLDFESVFNFIHQTQSDHLTVKANFRNHNDDPFFGYIDIIEPEGISIISDIDDTIKVTDILDGKDAILQNTFFRTAKEVPQMNEVYRTWVNEWGAHVHYVSNSPWQVYPALQEFMSRHNFPQGSMHLRSITTQELLFSRRNSGNAANKINNNKPGKHKLEMISTILQDFPYRKFILVGDSGEMDPEIYQQIYNEHPDQIIKIFIHDVSSHRAIVADRDNYNNNPQHQQSDSYYNSLQRFISRESTLLRRGATPQLAMDALAETEIPPNSNSQIIASTKLEQFEERMKQISNHMREGVFTVFTLASQLLLDPVITEEFLLLKASQDLFL